MARIIDSTYGHKNQIAKLNYLLANDRFPQSMLFVGPNGIGKKRVALAVAQSLVCEVTKEACGECGPCKRVEKQQSESLFVIQPEGEPGKKQSIKVEAVRDLLERLSLAPVGKARVVVIDSAHLMNEQASNAFLKTLEEPSENLYFILTVTEAQLLLQTIQSRVQMMRFPVLEVAHLKTIKPNEPDWAYRSCRGQLDRLEMLTSKQGLAERQEALQLLNDFCFNDDFLLFDEWRKSMREDRNWALFNVKCWLQIVRDAIVLKTQANKFVLNTDQSEFLKQMYELPVKKLHWFAKALLQAAKDIQGNQDASLVIDSLRVNYARVD